MLDYYCQQSDLSDPGSFVYLYETLNGHDISILVNLVQDLIVHRFWIDEYGLSLTDYSNNHRDINEEINIRPIKDILSKLITLEDKPLTKLRDPINRKVGFCRDHALLLTSLLRHYGVPARVRSGAATYFHLDKYFFEDHYVCEYWDGNVWRYADAQLDKIQKNALGIKFDTADLPKGKFFNAGEIFWMVKNKEHPPENFGVTGWSGETFARNKLVMDLACINKVEVLCWEGWGTCVEEESKLKPSDAKLFESVANLLLSNDEESFQKMRELFTIDPNFMIPKGYEHRQMKFPVN